MAHASERIMPLHFLARRQSVRSHTPYLANFLYITRFGSIESGPSRRTLSAS
jgi:hypothetical protein